MIKVNKKLQLLFPVINIFVAALNLHVSAPSCLPEGITFGSQAEINAFPTNYPGCTSIGGVVGINGPDIANLNGLSSLTSFGDNVFIYENPMLSSISGLSNISSVGGGLYIWDSPSLTSLSALSNLSTVAGSLEINGTSCSNLNGLENITVVGGDLRIGLNANLSSLSGLQNLTSVGGQLEIGGIPSLTNLNELANLTAINGLLVIVENPALVDISGLQNINPGTIQAPPGWTDEIIIIFNNPQLSQCAIQSICDALLNFGATANVYNNSSGCNSQSEIETACLLILPIELLSLQAQPQKTATHLTWRTASEAQNAYFEIEHSRNGVSFQAIGKVEGHGTTTEPHNYEHTHEHPGPGTHYYRLRQVDFDGQHSYSQVVSIDFPSLRDLESLALWPNPTMDIVNLGWESQEALEYVVTDALGRMLQSGNLVAGKIDLSAYPKGVYFLSLKTGNGMRAGRVVKQ
ncbi:MAG: T9SS type A sorting domain-containing protein [Saprospiraceae bacterium]|nr:T9SS type A sorting domain-containing protein [Saprospiraceae bacterium]